MTGKRRALLIATDSYSDATFQQLRAPRADADALASLLADPGIGGYEVQALHNPAAHVASLAIEDLFATVGLEDLVLLYVSGHGIKDDHGQLHLVMANSRHDRLNATAISAQFVRDQMDNTRSSRVVVILDCCFAGAFPPGSTHRSGENAGVLSQLRGRGSAVMTSSSALEYSYEAGESASTTLVGAARPSVFTGALVDGLRGGGADRNDDGLIDVRELYDFIYDEVEHAGKPQTPGLASDTHGSLIVATSPNATNLPPEVVQAIRSPLPAVRLAIVGELSARLTSGSANAAQAARTALSNLTRDGASSVAAAARAALARAETATSPSATTVVSNEVIQQISAAPRAGGASAAFNLTHYYGTAPPHGGGQQQERSPETRKALISTAIGVVALAAAVITTVSLLPDPARSNGSPQAEQVPPGFVAPPTRPTPLPDTVTCHYEPDGKAPVRQVEPPATGEVPATGLVRATLNTSIGPIPVVLDRSLAPCTVNDFIHLVEQGFYNDSTCGSASIPYVECGPAPSSGEGSPGYKWTDESIPEFQDYRRGYLVMHREYHADISLYFDDQQDDRIDATVFGSISEEGLRAIDAKRSESKESDNASLGDVTITNVTIQG
ncbi:caspase family protein [Saccharopolyspora sp. NPDC000359]|uniref:caspase, EACC1-associated type n=1 Tax=Saccharopolyspora sp. NPDC000359 TaxID=3154251 RepID=UPI0033230143